jgi:hypothetical protein
MSITVNTDLVDVQILLDAVRGVFKGKNAFMGSVLVSQGAVRVSGTMPQGGPGAIGKKIDVPYFGTLGEFANNADGSAVTPSKLAQVLEQATIARQSLATEASVWAQALAQVDPNVGDPLQEGANQLRDAAVRAMDKIIIDECKTTPLVKDVYSATTPVYIDWNLAVRAKTFWGDEQDAIVAMVVHSQTLADMATLTDSSGRPLLLTDQTQGQESVLKFAGVPLVVSDRVPLDSSTMGTVTSSGTAPPVATLAGTPTGPWRLVIDCITGDATTNNFKFSTDGGNTFSATIVALDDGVPVNLIDTAVDSLVGVNGKTGLTVAFAAGTFNADNLWKSCANLKVTDMILQRDAAAFWYNAQRLGAKSDVDILADADIIAMHLYSAAKLYRRRRGGSRPGCIAIKHNVRDFIGVVSGF